MKLQRTYSIFGIILLAFSAQLHAEKYGLAVGVSHFDPRYGVRSLHSPLNDVALISQAWQAQGFDKNNIAVLVDSQASKVAVWQAMQNLIIKCKAGDIVWLFFSTHGQKLQDFNGYSTDGYTNSLLMYDSPAKYEPGYHSQRHLTDEDIRVFSKKMRTKLGPKGELVLVIDACHSGLLMRGINDVKGMPDVLTEPGYNPVSKTEGMATDGFYSSIVESKEQETTMAPYVFYSACRSNEVFSEIVEKTNRQIVGPLALAGSQALTTAQPGETFRQMFSKILAAMNISVPNQVPVATGNGLDKIILGGNIKPRVFTYSIKNIISTDTVEISAGTFAGIYTNTDFSFYKIDDLKHEHLFVNGTVISAGPFSAIVALQKSNSVVTKQNSKVLEGLITKKSFDDRTIRVAIDTGVNIKDRQWIEHAVINCPVAELKSIVAMPDMFLRVTPEKKIEMLYPNGNLFAAIDFIMSNESANALAVSLEKFARAQAIKNLQMDNPLILADISVQAVSEGGVSDTLRLSSAIDNGGLVITHAGKDLLNIKITNSGSKIFYVNIVDIGSDGGINPIWPSREMDAAEYKVVPGKSFNRSFPVFPPYGMEYLKIILSADDINLGVIAATQGTRGSARGGNNPIEMLFRDEYSNTSTRGINKAYNNIDVASTFDVSFKIEP